MFVLSFISIVQSESQCDQASIGACDIRGVFGCHIHSECCNCIFFEGVFALWKCYVESFMRVCVLRATCKLIFIDWVDIKSWSRSNIYYLCGVLSIRVGFVKIKISNLYITCQSHNLSGIVWGDQDLEELSALSVCF